MAPVGKALTSRPETFHTQVISTGQHREMLDQVFDLFGFQPTVDLHVMGHNQTLMHIYGTIQRRLSRELKKERPQVMLVHGDTSTSFAGAMAAWHLGIDVGHVEAGLRTHDRFNPFPEEINRLFIDRLATHLYVPTLSAMESVADEGLDFSRTLLTGNTVVDALFDIKKRPEVSGLRKKRGMVLITMHRRENFGAPLRRLCAAIADLHHRHPQLSFVYPVHKNPNVREVVFPMLGDLPRVKLLEPVDYMTFLKLMAQAWLILTDSGGVQEEAPAFGTPVLVLRKKTERPEGVKSGHAFLVGDNGPLIRRKVETFLTDPAAYRAISSNRHLYGDGKAAGRIADHLAHVYGGASPPRPFKAKQ